MAQQEDAESSNLSFLSVRIRFRVLWQEGCWLPAGLISQSSRVRFPVLQFLLHKDSLLGEKSPLCSCGEIGTRARFRLWFLRVRFPPAVLTLTCQKSHLSHGDVVHAASPYAEVAQLAAHLICNQTVAGSIPVFSFQFICADDYDEKWRKEYWRKERYHLSKRVRAESHPYHPGR